VIDMNRKTVLAGALAGGALMGLSSVAQAVPAVVASTPYYTTQPQYVYTQPAPPPPLYEAIPAPRAGWVWAPGFYDWNDGRYVWTTGRWVQERPGWQWQEARWQQRSDGSWYLVGGQWVQSQKYGYYDEDRRGDRYERGPNGDMDHDGVRNADDADRDGDGVANRNDNFPNNPNRS
jgi:hypothetical protein